jgi:choline-sulfatase
VLIGPTSGGKRRVAGYLVCLLALFAGVLTCAPTRELEKPNIVLIVIDALRPDHLGCYGYDRPTSPVIDGLAREGILFETAIAAAPWTKTSFSSFLTSLYPFQHGVAHWTSIMPDSIVTLSEVLHDHGYNTMALVNMLGITDRFKVLKGTDEVSAAAKYKRDAPQTTDDAIEMMSNSPQPYFILIHYFDTHWPYRPPMGCLDMVRDKSEPHPLEADRPTVNRDLGVPPEDAQRRQVTMYDGCIRYVDDSVARLVDYFDQEGIRDNTVLIITADHGEAFWEHGVGSHGHNVHDEEIRVPLIFNNPVRYPKPGRIGRLVSLMDLVPTIVDLTHAPDHRHREGMDLNDLVDEGRLSRSEGSFLPADLELAECTLKKSPDTKCIRSDQWKLIVEPATSLVQLYNMRDDPHETVNLWGRGGAMGDSLLNLIQTVPGSTVEGWRLGFVTGEVDAAFTADVRLEPGDRLTQVERLVAGGEFALEIPEDSTSFHVEVSPKGQQIVLFTTEPTGAEVHFEFEAGKAVSEGQIHTGSGDTRPLGRAFTMTPGEALGIPEAFDGLRTSGAIGACLWWLPGRRAVKSRETALSPEERKRLKALGYIQ